MHNSFHLGTTEHYCIIFVHSKLVSGSGINSQELFCYTNLEIGKILPSLPGLPIQYYKSY